MRRRTYLVALLLLAAVPALLVAKHWLLTDWEEASKVGDYFNLLGALANAVALMVAFHELGLQRESLAQGVEAQEAQARAQMGLVAAQEATRQAQVQANELESSAQNQQAVAIEVQRALVDATNENNELQRRALDAQLTAALVAYGATLAQAGTMAASETPLGHAIQAARRRLEDAGLLP